MSGGRIWGKTGGAQSKTGGKISCHTQAQRGEAQGAIGDNTIQWVLVKQAFYFLFLNSFSNNKLHTGG